MPAFIIAYDLSKPIQNYPGVIDVLESYGTRYHMMQSKWIVVSNETAEVIATKLSHTIDDNDKLFVGRLSGEAAWNGLNEEGTAWLLGVLNGTH